MPHTNENIILVDAEDNQIGEIEKITAHEYGMLHRAFSVFIFRKRNNKLECLLQQRSIKKYHSRGLWSNTCCSHPHPNENVIESAEKKLKEEMGIEAKLSYAGKFHYIAPLEHGLTENEIDRVLIGYYDAEDIPINLEEAQAYRWIEIDDLKKDVELHPEKYTYWFKPALEIAINSITLPAWSPDNRFIQTTNLWQLMDHLGYKDYQEFYRWSVTHYADFWQLMVKTLAIVFDKPYKAIIDLSEGVELPYWFTGAKLNIANSCFHADKTAIAIIEQTNEGILKKTTYDELNKLSNRVANSIRRYLKMGDSVALIMPMSKEAVAIYLGIIKAGCSVISIAESFSTSEITTRLQIANAKAVLTQDQIIHHDKHLPLYEKIIDANTPFTIVLPTEKTLCCSLRQQDMVWDNFLDKNDQFTVVSCDPADNINILFSSGTTDEPKAIPWTHTTPIKCGSDAYLYQNIKSGDVLCWPTSLGWMMGPWSIFAAFLNRATLALYSGLPTGREFGQFIEAAKVTILGVVPTLVKNWRHSKCMEGLNWNSIKIFSSTGECSQPDDMLYLSSLANYRPVIEYCGGTEIGGAYITSTLIQPILPSTFNTPALGLYFCILDEQGKLSHNGEVALIPPSIGLSTKLLNKNHHEVYYAHMPQLPSGKYLRRHGDQVEQCANGLYRLHGRVDDTMNLSGIKTSSAEIELVLGKLASIREVAAIAVNPKQGGPSQLVIYVVPHTSATLDKHQLKMEMQHAIKKHLNPLFKIHDVVIVDHLLRTASNKVIRRTLRSHYQEE